MALTRRYKRNLRGGKRRRKKKTIRKKRRNKRKTAIYAGLEKIIRRDDKSRNV